VNVRTMTHRDLVDAVSHLGREPSRRLVSSVGVIQWCERQKPRIDCGREDQSRRYSYFELAEKIEPKGEDRLVKYKTSRAAKARNYWALKKHEREADAEARRRNWIKVPWAAAQDRWAWEEGEVP
jgi:hypothetical protein